MDEPMEDSTGEPKPEEPKVEVKSSVLRPGSMVMMTITTKDYEEDYWPKLENAINQLLTLSPAPGEYIPISYEQMYSCVYKCVCKQFSERLYSDLIQHLSLYLEQLSVSLQMQDTAVYIDKFNYALDQYLTALGAIVPIFNYMNRFYVELKLKTSLTDELRKLFVIKVSDRHIQHLIPLLVEANSKPFSVSPPVMSNLIKNLHALKKEYTSYHPSLFAKYIPNVLPPCSESELERYKAEVQQMQRDLLTHPDFISGDQGRKRAGEEDSPRNPVSFLPKTS